LIKETDAQIVFILGWRLGDDFQTRFKWYGQQRRVLGDIGLTVEIRAQRAHLGEGRVRRRISGSRRQIFVLDPSCVGVGCADVTETVFFFEDDDLRSVDRLRNHVGIDGGGGKQVGHRNADQGFDWSLRKTGGGQQANEKGET
jgi:hypothetical protein